MRQMTGYQVRGSGGEFAVFLVRADGEDISVDNQRAVYTHRSHDRAQVISDALNNGLVSRVVIAVNAKRRKRSR